VLQHAAPPPSMLIDRADTALASVVGEFDILSSHGGDVAVASTHLARWHYW